MLFDVQKFNPAVCEVLSGAQRKQPQPTAGRRTLHTQTQVTGARTPCFGLTEATSSSKAPLSVCLHRSARHPSSTPLQRLHTSQKKLELLNSNSALQRSEQKLQNCEFMQLFFHSLFWFSSATIFGDQGPIFSAGFLSRGTRGVLARVLQKL